MITGGHIQLLWRREYECGDETIDEQHRQIFRLGNTLVNAILNDIPKADIEILIDEFVIHVVDHFNTEEALMKHAGDPTENQHCEIHHGLLERAMQLKQRFHEEKSNMKIGQTLVSFIAYDVVAQHMILEDPKVNRE